MGEVQGRDHITACNVTQPGRIVCVPCGTFVTKASELVNHQQGQKHAAQLALLGGAVSVVLSRTFRVAPALAPQLLSQLSPR